MKSQFALKPLAFLVAAALASPVMAFDFGTDTSAKVEINDTQESIDNYVNNLGTPNDALLEEAAHNSTGNLGANVAAGDNNQQANNVAVANTEAGDEAFVFATIDVSQTGRWNDVVNIGNDNNATLENALYELSGVAGANVAAGANNQQKNDLAMANGESKFGAESSYAKAYVDVSQYSTSNDAYNLGSDNMAVLNDAVNDISGVVGANVAAGSGNQQSNAVAVTNAPGSAVADNDTLQSSTGNVTLNSPLLLLAGPLTTNDASLTNALVGISGHAGVNVAAGTGNQQANSLVISNGYSMGE